MCCTRRTWGLTIGYLNLVGGIALFILSICILPQLSSMEFKSKDEKDLLETKCIVILVYGAISSVCSALLLKGIYAKCRKMMIPYMAFCTITILLEIGYFFNQLGGRSSSADGKILLQSLLRTGVSSIFLWIIYCLYKDIRKEQDDVPVQASPRNTSHF